MPRRTRNRQTLLLAALPAVAWLLVQTSSASASCGDYVHVKPPGDPTADEALDRGHQPPAPCRGPHCHQAPDRPTPAPPPSVPTSQTDDATFAILVTVALRSTGLSTRDDRVTPRLLKDPLLDPPRARPSLNDS